MDGSGGSRGDRTGNVLEGDGRTGYDLLAASATEGSRGGSGGGRGGGGGSGGGSGGAATAVHVGGLNIIDLSLLAGYSAKGAAALEANAEENEIAAEAELVAEQAAIAKSSREVGLGDTCGAVSSTTYRTCTRPVIPSSGKVARSIRHTPRQSVRRRVAYNQSHASIYSNSTCCFLDFYFMTLDFI